jgi:hypothetical protein
MDFLIYSFIGIVLIPLIFVIWFATINIIEVLKD